MSLSLLAAAAEAPDQVALVAGGVSHTFAELAPRVGRVAGWIAAQSIHGGDPGGAPVALVADTRVDTLLALYALLELGLPVVAVHPRLTSPERAALLHDAAPALVLDESWREREVEGSPPARPAPPDDGRCLAIVFTSGTTGRPRGAMLGRAAFAASARASAANLGWQAGDRWLLCMPLAHVGGLSIVTRCLLARRAVVLAEPDGPGGRFDPASIVEAAARHRVTLLSVVPTMLRRLLDHPGWVPPLALRAVLVGGAAAPASLLDEAAERGVPALTTYGLTEACSQVTAQRYGTRPGHQHGAGDPLPGTELCIVDDEIHVRGPTLMTGYHPAAIHGDPFQDGGWFATGDSGAIDDRGRLHVRARRSDLIVTGGENVYPAEVEQALDRLPGIAAACVFGVPDDTWGERVAIALVPAAGGPPSDRELDGFLRANLAAHKRPRDVAFLDELPAGGTGKIDRKATARLATPRLRPLTRGPT